MDAKTEEALWGLLNEIVTELKGLRADLAKPKRSASKKKQKEEQPQDEMQKLVVAIHEQMRNDYGDDMPCPNMIKGEDSVTVDGTKVPFTKFPDVKKIIDNNPAATPQEVADAAKVPLAIVYMVTILTTKK